jgi:hypothetical protein
MDLDRMLAMCVRDQWKVEDLDWSVPRRELPPDVEKRVVQYFTDMAGIELLAAELFKVQRDRAADPTLRAIFETFVTDEIRHSRVAARLARHYDSGRHGRYELNVHLVRFRRHFVDALRHLTADIANAYITTGELLLDVALLRSLDDFVDDEMSHQAMRLINRDESRHIAVDYYMVEYYASDQFTEWLRAQPKKSPAEVIRGWWSVARFISHAAPFFKAVFFEPMELVDPEGRRLIEAFKRVQLLGEKEEVGRRPFSRFMYALRDTFEHPIAGKIFARPITRIMGVDPKYIRTLYAPEEAARARRMSFEELAEDALQAKYLH